ncbi:hypothetical protein HDV05_007533 [Chytridiales sp. JEL 0842]|nr:hypothetical protein HDV05_007533 [Chytridiales sp. JEL 0842]
MFTSAFPHLPGPKAPRDVLLPPQFSSTTSALNLPRPPITTLAETNSGLRVPLPAVFQPSAPSSSSSLSSTSLPLPRPSSFPLPAVFAPSSSASSSSSSIPLPTVFAPSAGPKPPPATSAFPAPPPPSSSSSTPQNPPGSPSLPFNPSTTHHQLALLCSFITMRMAMKKFLGPITPPSPASSETALGSASPVMGTTMGVVENREAGGGKMMRTRVTSHHHTSSPYQRPITSTTTTSSSYCSSGAAPLTPSSTTSSATPLLPTCSAAPTPLQPLHHLTHHPLLPLSSTPSSRPPPSPALSFISLASSTTSTSTPTPSSTSRLTKSYTALHTPPLHTLALRALTVAHLPFHTLILALLFVHRLTSTSSSSAAHKKINTPPKLFLAGLMLADIQLSDAPLSVKAWSLLSGLETVEVVAVRREAVERLEFAVCVGVEAYGVWLGSVKRFFGEEKMREAAKGRGALGRFLQDAGMRM